MTGDEIGTTSNPEKFLYSVKQEMNFRKSDKPNIGFS